MKQEKVVITQGQKEAIFVEMDKLKEQVEETKEQFGNSKFSGESNSHFIDANKGIIDALYNLQARLAYWNEILKNSTTELEKKDEEIVQIGSIVRMHELYEDQDVTIQILGTVLGIEDPRYEVVTANSNFGKVLLGKERRRGDIIPFIFDIENPCKYEITEIEWNDRLNNLEQPKKTNKSKQKTKKR